MTQIYRPEDDPEPVELEVPSGTPIYVDTQEEPIGYVADQCHAILWVEQKVTVFSERLGGDFETTARTKLVCRFATGHEDPFHEHYDGTRWMIQTEDR